MTTATHGSAKAGMVAEVERSLRVLFAPDVGVNGGGGREWTDNIFGGNPTAGNWARASNRAVVSSVADSGAGALGAGRTVDTGQSDGKFQCKLRITTSTIQAARLAIRVQDSSHLWTVGPVGGGVDLLRVIEFSGATTTVKKTAAFPVVKNQEYLVTGVAIGQMIRVTCGTTSVVYATANTFTSATRHGISAGGGTNATFDDYVAWRSNHVF